MNSVDSSNIFHAAYTYWEVINNTRLAKGKTVSQIEEIVV